jgi:hypothetical protein
MALPLLDAMIPAFARAGATPSKAPLRMAFVYVPNGIVMDEWTPQTTGDAAKISEKLPSILEPIAAYRENLLVLSGLTLNGGRALGDGPGDHARAGASFLTAAHPKKTYGADIQTGISVDQVAARHIGHQTRFASLELGCEEGLLGGNCDNGYSCAYSNSISWRTPSTPMPPEISPRAVFERLFGAEETESDPVRRARQRRYDRSILDFVLEDARRLQTRLGPIDRRKVDEYLFSVRDIEKRIEGTERESAAAVKPAMERPPSSIPDNFVEHARVMFDLLSLAFQTDLTRVSTVMLSLEQSNRNYREIGIPDSHHGLTHHRGDKEKIAKVARINRLHVEQFGYFLGKLNSIPDGDGTLLDHTMLLYGSGLSDGNRHDHHNLPVLIAGRANGTIHSGRHIRYPDETPMANLYIAMLDRMGLKSESFADSDGRLGYLSSL